MMNDMNEWIFDATASNFATDVVEKSKTVPVLVDFWADWCEPCKNLMPVLQSVVEQAAGALLLAKVNTDQEQAMAMQMGIQSLPTVALVKDGQVADSFAGLKSETELKEWLAPHVSLAPAEPEPVIDAGVSGLIQSGQLDSALAQLNSQAVDQVFGQLIQVHILKGDVASAQQIYDGLAEGVQQSPQGVRANAMIQVASVDVAAQGAAAESQQRLLSGQCEAAMEQLLQVLSQPGDHATVKQLLIAGFGLFEDPKTVASYRRRMSRMLF